MINQKQKSNKKYIATIAVLAVLTVGTIISTACLAWSLAVANEKIDYLQAKIDDLENSGAIEPGVIDYGDYVVKKPLIYLYPSEDTQVSVKVGNPSELTSTYPKYSDGWNVLAHKDGSLVGANGRSYYGLYWEGAHYPAAQTDEGFVVAASDTEAFLEEKLAQLGLTEREANEMIIYWLPQLEKSAYNYIRFDLNDVMDEYMSLHVSPQPDTMIRVSMVFKGLTAPIAVREQKLPIASERSGFVLVEWGGCEIK